MYSCVVLHAVVVVTSPKQARVRRVRVWCVRVRADACIFMSSDETEHCKFSVVIVVCLIRSILCIEVMTITHVYGIHIYMQTCVTGKAISSLHAAAVSQ